MNDVEEKALALVREVLTERNLSDKRAVRREVSPYTEALCRALEAHETFKQEVSDAVEEYYSRPYDFPAISQSFIISKPKPDPLERLLSVTSSLVDKETLRDRLEAEGLEIREKGQ